MEFQTVEKILQEWNELGDRFLTQMEKKRVGTVNRILALDEKMVERFLAVCERFGNQIADRLIAQFTKGTERKNLSERLLLILEENKYDLAARLTSQAEINDLCMELATMIVDKVRVFDPF